MTLIEYMCQEKEREEDMPMRIPVMQQYKDTETTKKARKKNNSSHQRQYRQHEDQHYKNN